MFTRKFYLMWECFCFFKLLKSYYFFILNSFTRDCNHSQALCLIYYVRVKKLKKILIFFLFFILNSFSLDDNLGWALHIHTLTYWNDVRVKKYIKKDWKCLFSLTFYGCFVVVRYYTYFTDFYLCNNVLITSTMFFCFFFEWSVMLLATSYHCAQKWFL